MGKVEVPETKFIKKIFFALMILIGLILVSDLVLILIGFDSHETFSKAVSIVTHVEVVEEEIAYKYLFVIFGIMGEVVQFYLIYVLLEYLLEGRFKDVFSGVKHMNMVKNMRNHYIIAGGGRVGYHAAKALEHHKKKLVIVDSDDDMIAKLRREGFVAVKGDVLDESFLEEINIKKAKQLIACLGKDSDNILLVLTANEMNPAITVSARANSDTVVDKLRHAGAKYVVVPSSLGGENLAKFAERSS